MEKFTKPFAAAWRGRGYFVIGVIFWICHSIVVVPAIEPTTSWYLILLYKALGSLDKISYAVLVAGLAYVILSDVFDYIWSTSLKTEFLAARDSTGVIIRETLGSFAASLNVLSYEAIKVWVEGGKGTSDQRKLLGVSALKSSFGPPHTVKDEFIDFLSDDIIDNWSRENSQVWENYQVTAVLRPSKTIANHLEWEENKSYDIVCRSGSGKVPFLLETSLRIDNSKLEEVLNNMKYQIKLDKDVIMDFEEWWKRNKSQASGHSFEIKSDGYWLKYNEMWLGFEFSKECDVSAERATVSIHEHSLISEQDRCYAIAVRHPTKGLRVSLSVESDSWAVKPAVTSALLYRNKGRGVSIESPHSRRSQVSVTNWTLPGLAVLIEWTPTKLS